MSATKLDQPAVEMAAAANSQPEPQTAPEAVPRSALAPLGYRPFREIWMASLVSNLGGLVQSVGAAWLMTSIAGSADKVALVQASVTLPIMIFSLASGAIADTLDRRRVMLAAQVLMLSVSALLAAFTYLGLITPWTLLIFTFLIGCGTALNNPSWQASVGDMVPRPVLPAAVTLNSVNFNLTRSVGPAVGGLIVATAGAPAAFLANAVSYLPLLFAIFRWNAPRQPSTLPPEAFGNAMTAGLRYVAVSPHITKVLLRGFVFGFSAVAVLALVPIMARELPGGGPLLYGVLLGCYGAGAVAGAFLGGRARDRWRNETLARAAFIGFAASAAIVGSSSTAIVTALGMALGGACWVLALSMFNVTVQLSTPRWVVGRALALYQTAVFGGMAAGAWLWGVLAEAADTRTALLSAALAMFGGALVGLRWPLPDRTDADLTPLNRWKLPSLALDLQGRSGPVAILIEYQIRDEDTGRFLEVMAEQRRVRRRDGARQWELMRDTQDPEHWMESYHVPTWNDYVRHNQRRTKADAGVWERIRELHAGSEPPKVRRLLVRPAAQSDGLHPERTEVGLS